MTDFYYIMFSHCFPVKGAVRSLICNIQSGTYYFIPNDMFEVVSQHRIFNITNLVSLWGEDNRQSLSSYIDLLVLNESVFRVSDPKVLDYFPALDFQYDSPSVIDNAIIDFNFDYDFFISAISQLSFLGCRAVLVRILGSIQVEVLDRLLQVFDSSSVQHIEILISEPTPMSDNVIEGLFCKYLRLSVISLFGCSKDVVDEVRIPGGNSEVLGLIKRQAKLYDPLSHCDKIDVNSFILNLPHFSESLSFNTCLNKKVSIDVKGNVRNCPFMVSVYGNMFKEPLISIVNIPSFKLMWNITKDKIDVCKDCEFRYMCSDCRAHSENSSDLYSKPKICSYDPYNAKWEN